MFTDPLQKSHAWQRCWNCYKTFTFCSLLKRCKIPCACHTKRHLNVQVVRDRRFLTLMQMCSQRPALFRLPKVVRTWGALHSLTSKCASRHNGVYFFDISTSKSAPRMVCCLYFYVFFISHLARWLRTSRFSEPTFRPSGATNHWKKTQWFATFLPFRPPASSFFWLRSLLWSSLFFSSLLFSDSSHLCFFICPYCRKFDFSKLSFDNV